MHDFRLEFLDDYRVHNMAIVKDWFWKRGHLKIKIGGGCTPIMCGCDLHLHADVEQEYLDLDLEWAAAELLARPWIIPTKTRQLFVSDWACIWDRFPHKRTGAMSMMACGLGARPPQRVTDAANHGSPSVRLMHVMYVVL